MSFDLPSLIVIHTAMMVAFAGLFAAISWIDNDWRFPWHFSVGFLLAPSVMLVTGVGQTYDQPIVTLLGVISGYIGPAVMAMGAAQFAGIAWPVHRWVTGFFVFSTIHVAVWLTGVGLIGNLMVLNIGLAAFALMLVLVARRLPKEDHRLGRPLIMLLSAATALAQIVRLFLIFYRGWGDEKWMPLSATMIVGATVIAAFGVACIIILVAERFAAQIRREARTDPLTGLAMRRVFDDQIEAELARWRRYRRQFAVVLFDIDHFKRVNDAHGHDVGDEALRHVARCGTTAIRPSDLLVRLGGDEFALILPESAVQDALEVSGRLLGALRETPLKLPSGQLILTGSFGVAAAQSVDDTVEQIVKRADEALYLVKRQGRNGVAALPQAPLEALHDAPADP